ncbi:MAG TPA: hypothetical protein PKX52_06785 [Methanomassiliicoccaceae archaeon]|nr:hypothetical protein [Methanomassiliicoccaceae archaeon]
MLGERHRARPGRARAGTVMRPVPNNSSADRRSRAAKLAGVSVLPARAAEGPGTDIGRMFIDENCTDTQHSYGPSMREMKAPIDRREEPAMTFSSLGPRNDPHTTFI